MPRALLALAIGAFGIGTTEFVVMGMLPDIAAGLDVSVPAVGLLISAYAVGVVIGAPTLTALGLRFTPRQTLVALMVVFVVGNALAALAPTYGTLAAARVLTALSHGSFFGVGAVAARRLVPPERATQAISLMITGLTLANVIGVPLGTFVAQQTSWRLVLGGIALIGLVTIAGLLAWMPADAGEPADLRGELRAFRRAQVWLVLGLTMVGFAAMFAVYSYVSPILTELGGIPDGWVTPVLGPVRRRHDGGHPRRRAARRPVRLLLRGGRHGGRGRRPRGLRLPGADPRRRGRAARALRDGGLLPRPGRAERRHRGRPSARRQPGLGGQPGCLQRGQRPRRGARCSGDLRRARLHRAHVGRRGARAGRGRHRRPGPAHGRPGAPSSKPLQGPDVDVPSAAPRRDEAA